MSQSAFANGELCHAMEYCNIMFPAIHVSEFVVPPLLALAENLESSGRDLIPAMALAHKMPTRLQYGTENMQ
jgi:2-methylcitrate dehydratase PrpD